MTKATTVDITGASTGQVELPADIFGLRPHRPVLHQALIAELAAGRAGTHATRTRGQVRGGGRKPWRQKGTGRARAGSRRSPIWVGGGITFGPHPREHTQRQPRKMRELALRSALSAQAAAGRVVVVDPAPAALARTKAVAALLRAVSPGGGVAVITADADGHLARAAANIRGTHVVSARRPVLQHLLAARTVVVTKAALAVLQELLGS
jgi:large subunit ribosomal protein L4